MQPLAVVEPEPIADHHPTGMLQTLETLPAGTPLLLRATR